MHDTPSPDDRGLFAPGRASASVGALALISLLAFEALAVATAMPAVADALGGLSLYALSFGGMVATSALGMVWAGPLCDRRGPWRATVLGLVFFTAGLLLAGSAGSMAGVAAGRVVQGLGSGLLGVALYVGMGRVVPPALHPRLFALFAAAWVLPGLVGPALAATLVHHLGWRAVFLAVAALVPVAGLLLRPAFAPLAPLPAPADAASPTPSFGALAWAALAAAGALALHEAGSGPLTAPRALALGAAGGAVLLGAWRLLPQGSLQARAGLPAVIAVRAVLAAAFAGAEAFLPLLLTREAGWSLGQTGLALSLGAVTWSLGSQCQARLKAPATRRRGLGAGLLSVAAGLGLVMAATAGLGPWGWLLPGWAAAGFGIGLGFPMLSVLTLQLAAPEAQGRAASALQLGDALACSTTLALAGVLFNAAGSAGRPAFLAVLGLCAGLALLGAALAPRAFALAQGAPGNCTTGPATGVPGS